MIDLSKLQRAANGIRPQTEQGGQAVKIEEGKYYRTRDGRKVGPMHNNGVGWVGAERIEPSDDFDWYPDGTFLMIDKDHDMTVVSEWSDDDGELVSDAPIDDYATLRAILDDAYAQAASGKGKERHANDRPFLSQPICEIGRMLGSVCDGELYQAIKKAQEASNMLFRGERDKAEHELLGAINYLAAAVILIREAKA